MQIRNMSYNPFSLEGKTILVTGASSGIGRATAIECSKMGAQVIITGRNTERLQETLDTLEGEGHQKFVADLVSTDDMNALVAQLGVLDGVVLCAGRGKSVPVQFATRDNLDLVFEVNFFSTIELLRVLYKKKRIKKEGSVVLMASVGGNHIYNVGNSIYGASKAALNSMMKFCAKEFAVRKIRVNSICPGMVVTPLTKPSTFTAEQLKADMETYPLKRYGQPQEIAYAAVYLLSDAASWVTGHDLVIDGGLTI